MSANIKYKTNHERILELIEQLNEADIAYYRDDSPLMSDYDYDILMNELNGLEKDTGLILSGSPTQKVSGEILDELIPVRHTRPMLSADKTKSVDDFVKFVGERDVILSWKLDGLTIVLRYENGRLVQAITRGREGIIGEDVTHTVRAFMNVPLSVPVKESFEIRGEGVVSWKNFDRLNLSLEEPYKSIRNFASGSTRKLCAAEIKIRRLEFFAFDLITDMQLETKHEQLEFMRDNGFSIVPYKELFGVYSDEINDAMNEFDPKQFAYPVDGLIIEYDDIIYGKSLGATGHHDNRLLAFKWEDELHETKLSGVDFATTRTGMVSITGLCEPVEIDGSTVRRAYLHNLDIFESFKFGIGDTIQVFKANMIVPQIARNDTKSNTYVLPTRCPCCGDPLIIKNTSGGTRQLFCENPYCAAKLVQKFDHFCEKTRMNIKGLSVSTLEKFIGHGWIRNFGDLYELEKHYEDIINTEGFGVKSYNRLQDSIEKSRHCTLAKFIAGLGIPMVGRHAGRDLDQYFEGSWEAFEQAICNGFDFTQLPNFGETMHNNIYQWYADEEEEKLWRPLLNKVEFIKEDTIMSINEKTPLFGKTVVATGKLENYSRDSIQAKLIGLGAVPTSSVTKKTDYLIVGEKAGSKLAKAQQLGIKTLTEQEFEDMIAE